MRHRLVARSTGNAMHMIGEDNPGIDAEGCTGAHPANRVAQYVDLRHQQIRTGVAQVYGKEEGSARNPIAAIIRHAVSMPELSERRNALRFSALRLLIIRQTLSPRIVYMQGRARQSWRFPVRWASLEIADAPSRPSETSRRLSRTPDR